MNPAELLEHLVAEHPGWDKTFLTWREVEGHGVLAARSLVHRKIHHAAERKLHPLFKVQVYREPHTRRWMVQHPEPGQGIVSLWCSDFEDARVHAAGLVDWFREGCPR